MKLSLSFCITGDTEDGEEDEGEEEEGEEGEDEGEDEDEEDLHGIDIGGPTQAGGGGRGTDDSGGGATCGSCGRGENVRAAGRTLIACDGGCDRVFHLRCVGLRAVPVADWICGDCSSAPTPDEDERRAQRPSQRRRAALQSLQQRNWG